MDDSEDREAILARRALLIAGALAGLGVAGCEPEGALGVDAGSEPVEAGAADAADTGGDAGNDAARVDGAAADAGAAEADAAVAVSDGGDAGIDGGGRDGAPRGPGSAAVVRRPRPKRKPEPMSCLFMRPPDEE